MRPTSSLEPTRTGTALGPQGGGSYHPPRGPSDILAFSAQLKCLVSSQPPCRARGSAVCDGNFTKDPAFVALHHGQRFARGSAAYVMRGRYRQIGGGRCVYCGFEAETGDHVPSLFAGYTNGVVGGVIVPVCADCNRALGPFASTCFRERLELVALVFDQLARKNQVWASNPKAGPQWSEKVAKFTEKAAECRKRKAQANCKMLSWQ